MMKSSELYSAPPSFNRAYFLPLLRKHRVTLSRCFGASLMGVVLFSEHRWETGGGIDLTLHILGFVLTVLASFGRVWASLYISGYKNRELITSGPYSVVRNPLYVFSLIGAIGLGCAAESFLLLFCVVVAFAGIYPQFILGEEEILLKKFGESYEAYLRSTPRFIPDWSRFEEPEGYMVNAVRFRKSIFDCTWFIWLYGLLHLVETLHHWGILPVYFRIP